MTINNRRSPLAAAVLLSLLVPIVIGCGEFGGGALVVPEVVVLPADSTGTETGSSGGDTSTGGGTEPVSSGGVGTLSGKVVLTGSLPDLPLPLIHGKGAAVKDAVSCSREAVPDERLIVNKDNGNGVANVFVYLAKKPKGASGVTLPSDPVVYDQNTCRFTPHCLVVATGQPVKILNNDEVPHNANVTPLRNDQVNQVISPKEREGKLQITYTKAEKIPFAVKCDYHTWMIGYHLPIDHPYAALTDENGEFEIPNLPAGKYEFVVWHEAAGYVHRKFKVEVAGGDAPTSTTIDFDSGLLNLN